MSELNVMKSLGDYWLKLGMFGLYLEYFGKFFKIVIWVVVLVFFVKRLNKGVIIC